MADKKEKPDKAEQAAKAEQTAKSDQAAKAKREGKARQAQQKQASEEAKAAAAAPLPPEPKLPARLHVRFDNEIAPVLTRARKAISNFKLRQGMPIGVMVTLRREKMWEFFDRLVNISLPRVRDF